MMGHLARLFAAGAMALVIGCDSLTTELEGDPEDVPLSEVITLERHGTGSLPADGEAKAVLTALIPKDASSQLITFRTTAGVFPLSGGKELKVRATKEPAFPDHRTASAVLRADTVAGTAIVSATVGDFVAFDSIRFVRP